MLILCRMKFCGCQSARVPGLTPSIEPTKEGRLDTCLWSAPLMLPLKSQVLGQISQPPQFKISETIKDTFIPTMSF